MHSDATARAQEALARLTAQSERQRRVYEAILSNTPDLAYVFDLNHRFTYANQALLTMWGRSWAEAIGKNCLELGYPDWHAEMHDREIDRVIATRQSIQGEVPFEGTNGRRFYDYIFVPVFGANDQVEAVAGTTRDVTERKRKEDTLRFFVELNSAVQPLSTPSEIMSTTACLLGEYLAVDRCAYAEVENEAVFVITGDYLRGVPSIVGRWPVEAFGKECTRAMLANESYVVCDAELDSRIGPQDLPAYRATNIRAVICLPLHKSGKFTAAMAVHQTTPRQWTSNEIELVQLVVARCWESLERARTVRSLQRSEQRLRFMAESMPQKIFTAKPGGEIDYVNAQWNEFTGRTLQEVQDWGWLHFVHPDDREENVRLWKHSIATGEPFQIEHRFLRHDGVYRWHLTRAHPMRGGRGNVLMWLGSNTDITEMVQARETVAERRRELERLVSERTASLREAVEQMEEFSYSVSHDLRAPLRSMHGYAEVVLEEHSDQLDDEGRDYLRRILSAASRMDRLTLDVLTYSKLARTPVQLKPVALDELVTECIQHYSQFSTGRAQIEVLRPLGHVLAHEPQLMQAVSNLVGNALKFVAKDTVPQIRLYSEARDGLLRLCVRDNGIGVPSEYQRRIWGMFERVHPEGGYEGTGIGLAIVRKAMEKMGGTVGLESDGRTGSIFWIQLPPAAQAAPRQLE